MNTQSRKEQEKIARKNEILEASLQLFAEKGFHKVTVDEIAERVGLSKGTVYLYFKNKEDLFFSIVQEKAELLYQRLQSTIIAEKPFTECLRNYSQAFLVFFEDHKPYFKIAHSESSHLDANSHYRLHQISIKLFKKFFDLMDSLIEIGQKQKIVREVDKSVLSKSLRGILNSYTFHRVFLGSEESVEKEVDHLVDLFLHGAIRN